MAAMNAGTGAQALVAAGMTETPKFSLLEMTTATVDGTLAAGHQYDIGCTDGTTQRAMATLSETGVVPGVNDNGGAYDTATVIQHTNAANNNRAAEASHTSFAAGTHNINIDDAPVAQHLIKYLLIGGADVQVAINDLTTSATIGNTAAVSGLSFAPNLVIVFGRGNAAFAADTNWAARSLIIGFAVKTATGAIEQFCWADAETNNAVTCRSMLRSNRVMQRVTGGADQGAAELTSWDAGGATFTTRDVASATSVVVASLLLPRRRLRAFTQTLDTDGTGNKAITGLGFRVGAYGLFATDLSATDTSSTGADTSKYSHGFVDDVGGVALVGGQTEDAAVGSTDTRSIASTSKVAHVLDDAGGVSWSATHVSKDADGFTVNVDDASAADRVVGVLAISEELAQIGLVASTRRFRRQLARM